MPGRKSAFAALLLLVAGAGLHAEDAKPPTTERKVIPRPAIQSPKPLEIEPGDYLLVEALVDQQVLPPGEGIYPRARPVKITRDEDGNLTMDFGDSGSRVALEVLETSLFFQTIQKDPQRIRTTVYGARSKDPIQGRFYVISSVGGLQAQGTFTLQPQK